MKRFSGCLIAIFTFLGVTLHAGYREWSYGGGYDSGSSCAYFLNVKEAEKGQLPLPKPGDYLEFILLKKLKLESYHVLRKGLPPMRLAYLEKQSSGDLYCEWSVPGGERFATLRTSRPAVMKAVETKRDWKSVVANEIQGLSSIEGQLIRITKHVSAEELTAKQIGASETALVNLKVREEIREANQFMLEEMLHSPLYVTHLERLNEILARPSLRKGNLILAGVMRGSPVRWKNGEKVNLETRVLKKDSEGLLFPADWVLTRMNPFVSALNVIGPNSRLQQIGRLYRDFLVTKPFIEANGRTAHVLLHLMMMKAWLPPITQNLNTRMVIHKTVEEVKLDLLRAYQKEYGGGME